MDFLHCFLLLTAGAGFFTLGFFIWIAFIVVKVQGSSMFPTLKEGDSVVILRYWPTRFLSKCRIVLVDPNVPPFSSQTGMKKYSESLYIKRITGLPGETVTAPITELGNVDQPHERTFYDDKDLRHWRIPSGYFFLCSDNPRSIDSRTWGPLPYRCLRGVVILKLPSKRRKNR